jgi:EAL domain-containing protein (putative c-di-GMP-specific phosphodiesterase class I)
VARPRRSRGTVPRVNVSAPEVAAVGLLPALERALAVGLDPAGLSLELDETALLHAGGQATVAANLRGVHDRGVALVVDRFGLGDGSLGVLDGFPVSVLKLDRGVIARAADHRWPQVRSLAQAVSASRGSTGVPCTLTSKCRWGPVDFPVEPTRPMT